MKRTRQQIQEASRAAEWRRVFGSPWKVQIMNVNKSESPQRLTRWFTSSSSLELAVTNPAADVRFNRKWLCVVTNLLWNRRQFLRKCAMTQNMCSNWNGAAAKHHPVTHKILCALHSFLDKWKIYLWQFKQGKMWHWARRNFPHSSLRPLTRLNWVYRSALISSVFSCERH